MCCLAVVRQIFQDFFKKIKKSIMLLAELMHLPRITIKFFCKNPLAIDEFRTTYEYFVKPHRFKIVRNKTIGVALIKFNEFFTFEEFYQSVNGKNSAAYYSRKAVKRGYKFIEIDRNSFAEDIFAINTSASHRQGREMSVSYKKLEASFINKPNFRYYGIINKDNKLLSYCNIGYFGEFIIVSRLLGHKDYLNDGIMYLMMIEVIKMAFSEYKSKGYNFFMYDTFFGASSGLKLFKTKLGFKPYRVKWLWVD